MNPNGPQTTDLPDDYFDVMLPELLETGAITEDAKKEVLRVLEENGFHPAVSMLTTQLLIADGRIRSDAA